MKTLIRSLTACAPLCCAPLSTAELKVHEWGTFTVLQGTDGAPVRWYQPWKDLNQLPEFVRPNPYAGKSGPALLRMETPVIYFYPDKEMDVKVGAAFPSGVLTEWFPAPVLDALGQLPLIEPNGRATWSGKLRAPGSAAARHVPGAEGVRGSHYGAARLVPDAWLFESSVPQITRSEDGTVQNQPPSVEHFIFYRGAGENAGGLITAATEDDATWTLSNEANQPVPVLFLLRVGAEKASWTRIENLPISEWHEGHNKFAVKATLPAPVPLKESAEQLHREMVKALHAEGLTEAESEAMVQTWQGLWFNEPGARVLAVLPQSVADRMLPLTIEPKPEQIDRVFVQRVELISKKQEAQMVALLNETAGADQKAARAARLREIGMGRFSWGAAERAVELKARQMRDDFLKLDE